MYTTYFIERKGSSETFKLVYNNLYGRECKRATLREGEKKG